MFTALVYVLRTGIQWNALPRERGASTTVYDRFRLWEKQGFFTHLWQGGLQEYDELVGLDWEWQSMDGVMTKAPLGGGATGANPTDRGKSGTKRSQFCEGHGLPLALALDGANIHDTRLVAPTLVLCSLKAVTKETSAVPRRLRRTPPDPGFGPQVELSGGNTGG